jgi:hypothetical protein
MFIRSFFVVASLGLGLTGCASITQGTAQTLIFNLEPKDINCMVTRDGDGQIGTLTMSNSSILVGKDKDDIVVACKAPGHKPKTIRLTSSASAAGVVGGAFIDLGITDLITGAMWKYPESTNIALEKE